MVLPRKKRDLTNLSYLSITRVLWSEYGGRGERTGVFLLYDIRVNRISSKVILTDGKVNEDRKASIKNQRMYLGSDKSTTVLGTYLCLCIRDGKISRGT